MTARKRPSPTAIHEAGHIVAAIRLGWDVLEAGKHPRPLERNGVVELGVTRLVFPRGLNRVPRAFRPALEAELARQRCIVLAAGEVAQRLAFRRSRNRAGQDRRQAAILRATMSYGPASDAALHRHALAAAAELIRRDWTLVVAIAEALDKGEMLPGGVLTAMAACFDLRDDRQEELEDTSDVAGGDASPPPRLPRMDDLATAALQAVTARLAAGDQESALLFERTLVAVALRRNVDIEAARRKLAALADAEAVRMTWRPVAFTTPGENK